MFFDFQGQPIPVALREKSFFLIRKRVTAVRWDHRCYGVTERHPRKNFLPPLRGTEPQSPA